MLIDISIPVSPSTPEWPGDTPYSCGWSWAMSKGASVNVSSITTSPHVGTHADAPVHVRDGWTGVEQLPLEAFHGPAVVVDVSDAPAPIDLAELERRGAPRAVQRLLLRTGRSIAEGHFPGDWPVLDAGCVRTLLERGLALLGVDAPSVDERESRTLTVHRMLFAGGACILENLDLRHVAPGPCELMAFPVKLVGLDAAPVRAVLRR